MIAGDYLDMHERMGHQSTEKRHRDLHLFTSNVIFSRIAETDNNTLPVVDLG